MDETNEETPPRQGPQFSLGSLLIVIAVVAGLFAAGRCYGWMFLYNLLLLADSLGAIAVMPLPIVVVAIICSPEIRPQMGSVFLMAGIVLLVHLAVVVISLGSVFCQPLLPEPHPYDRVVFLTLNFTVPAAATGLLIAVVFFRNAAKAPWYRTGIAVTACGCIALVWYGNYFLSVQIRVAMAEVVWWW